jgi:hypothetical protein
MVSQGAKICRARLTRHSWCVRRILRREITLLSPDCYQAAAGGGLTAAVFFRGRLEVPCPFTFRAGIFNLEQEDFGRLTARPDKENRLAGFEGPA